MPPPAQNQPNSAALLVSANTPLQISSPSAPLPTPSPTQLLIRNHAIAINPADWKLQLDPSFIASSLPFVLGEDIAGQVVAVGDQVSVSAPGRFKVGDRVLSHVDNLLTHSNASGGFQLYTAAPISTSALIPANITYTEACVLPLGLDTALVGLVDILKLPYPCLSPTSTGKTILIWGGSSSVGACAIQLAVAAGVRVVATASRQNHEFVRSLGADEVVDYKDEDVVRQIRDAIGEGQVAGVFDAISTEESYRYTVQLARELGAEEPVLATVQGPPCDQVLESVKATMVLPIRPDIQTRMWEEYVTQALEQGKLKCLPQALVVGKGLESVQKGLDTSKAGVSARKVVVELV